MKTFVICRNSKLLKLQTVAPLLDTDAEIEVSNINDNSGNLQGMSWTKNSAGFIKQRAWRYKRVLMYILCMALEIDRVYTPEFLHLSERDQTLISLLIRRFV